MKVSDWSIVVRVMVKMKVSHWFVDRRKVFYWSIDRMNVSILLLGSRNEGL